MILVPLLFRDINMGSKIFTNRDYYFGAPLGDVFLPGAPAPWFSSLLPHFARPAAQGCRTAVPTGSRWVVDRILAAF